MKRRYIIPILLLLLAACTSEEPMNDVPETKPVDTTVSFSAYIDNGGSRSDESEERPDYLHRDFIPNQSRIRIVNTVNYSIPQFNTENEYEEYLYVGKGHNTEEHETVDNPLPNFKPVEENGGFDWNLITPTANNFIFEAVCYPNRYKHFEKVEADQSTEENLLASDLLIAHHKQDLKDRYEMVELHFYHAFAMLRIEVDLPVSTAQQFAGGFPADAIQLIKLVKINRDYEIDYTSAIDNNSIRPVSTAGDKQHEIKMYEITREEVENGIQHYEYCAILPPQDIKENLELVEFTILTYPGTYNEETNEWGNAEEKKYFFTPLQPFSLQQAHVTTLRLTYEVEEPEMIQVNATVEPWGNWYTGMELEPIKPGTTPDSGNETN